MIYEKGEYVCLYEDGEYNVYKNDEKVGNFDSDKDAIEFIDDENKDKPKQKDNKPKTLPVDSVNDNVLKDRYSDDIYSVYIITWPNGKRRDNRLYKSKELAEKSISFRNGNYNVEHMYAVNGKLRRNLPNSIIKEGLQMEENKLKDRLIIDIYPEDSDVHIYHEGREEGGTHYPWRTGTEDGLIDIFKKYIKNQYLADFR